MEKGQEIVRENERRLCREKKEEEVRVKTAGKKGDCKERKRQEKRMTL